MPTSLIFSHGIKKIPHLASFFPNEELAFARIFSVPKADSVLGWGLRPSTKKSRAYAQKHNLPFIALEDGFLRSIGLGVDGYPPLSMVVDKLGIYYDTTRPSRLEQLVLAGECDEVLAEKTQSQIVTHQLSKYNQTLVDYEKEGNEPLVLVIDQTFGDMAVKYGQADAEHFAQMLQAAITENPDAKILVKTHPDVLSGKKQGYFSPNENYPSNVHFFSDPVNPISLIKAVEKVYCVTSQMGFEALLVGKPVVTFGVPWFAGWGVTDDRHPNAKALAQSERRKVRSILKLFYAAYFQYTRYLNPNTGKTGTIFDVINHIIHTKALNLRLQGNLYCVGMSLWKRAVIKPFFRLPSCKLHFVKDVSKLNGKTFTKNDRLLLWGTGKEAALNYAKAHNINVLRMEDGFIRSVGLGSNLVAPLSLVCDDLGIYFNAENPSRLEEILQHQQFTEADLIEASQLQQALVSQHIGKYNVGEGTFSLPNTDKKKILVVGQVEDDASIQTGSPNIRTNLDLLKTVREANPEVYIIYKPHPDVVSGNRIGHIAESQAVKLADQIAKTENVLDCINAVDELHTMTSLAGFEALLRNKTVHCYGLPFYSHWGLTVDHCSFNRRSRKLSLLELIAGTLIYYPQYVNPNTGELTNAQTAIEILKAQRLALNHSGIHRHWLAKQYGKLQHLVRALRT